MSASKVIDYLRSLQLDTSTIYIPAIFARCVAIARTSLGGNRAVFNQIHLLNADQPIIEPSSPSIIAPVGLKNRFKPDSSGNSKSFWCDLFLSCCFRLA